MTPLVRKSLAADYLDGRWIAVINTVIAAGVFFLDCKLPTGVSVNSLYSLVIVIAALSPVSTTCLWWAAIASVLSPIASVVAPSDLPIYWEVFDRGMTTLSLWIVALVVYRLRETREEVARQRVKTADASAAKTRFLSAASHDLRQPVQSLMLFTAVLKEKLKGHAAEEIAASITAAVEALKRLLDDIFDIAKLDAGALHPKVGAFTVGEVLLRLVGEYGPRAADKGVRLRIVPTKALVESDPALTERILRNLVDNAVRYTQRGGILIGGRRRGGHMRLDVIDTGQGIAPDQIARIFEEFYQVANPQRSRERGYGLGLAIVKRMADLLGHAVDVESNEGRGSRFSLFLPLVPQHADGEKVSEPVSVANMQGMPVLVIEDDPLVLPAIAAALEGMNCRVATAAGRVEAMAAAQVHRPALIIADFRLPGERDGIQVVSDIRSLLGTEIPASLLTGDINPAIGERSRRLGIGFLRKPIAKEDLAALLAETHRRA